eukprot:1154121-Pelagomonas_calceolata.AAC.7
MENIADVEWQRYSMQCEEVGAMSMYVCLMPLLEASRCTHQWSSPDAAGIAFNLSLPKCIQHTNWDVRLGDS